jgi:putative N6-adenine-specific DNA methylase/tRNA (guanine6-N2)-methyltransferase
LGVSFSRYLRFSAQSADNAFDVTPHSSPTPGVPIHLTLTTNIGLEDIAVAELGERLAAFGLDPAPLTRADGPLPGRVTVRHPGPQAELLAAAAAMRSIHHVLRPVADFPLDGDEPLAGIERELATAAIPELAEAPPFRVTSAREGEHGFTSHDLQRVAGAVLVARYGAPVDLRGFEVAVRVDVAGSHCAVAVQLTRRDLANRYARAFAPRVALRANVAYACLRLGEIGPATGRLLDPFCGSGTILLEAGAVLPETALYGSDRQEKAVAGAHRNLAEAGLTARAELRPADALSLDRTHPAGFFDAIVTNPPYGARLGRGIRFGPFYAALLTQARHLLRPGGRLVVLVRKRSAFHRALAEVGGFRVRQERMVETSGVYPVIFVLERAG